jgi:hypothetical protein
MILLTLFNVEATTFIGARVPATLADDARLVARMEGVSVSELVRRLLVGHSPAVQDAAILSAALRTEDATLPSPQVAPS